MSHFNRELQSTLEASLREAVQKRHAYLTVEHLLLALTQDESAGEILQQIGSELPPLQMALEEYLDTEIEKSDEDEADVRAMQTLGFRRVLRTALQLAEQNEANETNEAKAGEILLALFNEPNSHAVELLRAQGITRQDLTKYLAHGISKMPAAGGDAGAGVGRGRAAGGESEGLPANPLTAFATNLTQRAAEGKLDPLIGRLTEIARAVHVLARRRKNNPIFVGESGVGKTALAEGLAQRIHEGRAPEDLKSAEIFAVDIGALLAGTRYRGDFEERFKALVAAVQKRENPVVFIDEIHTILGAGSAQGATVDAANLLKPLLQSGELRCIGSTTYREYRHFERDRALARRFQKIDVGEPTQTEALKILEGLAPRYEAHHNVRYAKSALRACVELSARHIQDRFLPDKAIDAMDEVGAAVRLSPTPRALRQREAGVQQMVGLRDVEKLIARMTGAPLARATRSERENLAALQNELRGVVFGQDAAVATVVRAVKRARAGLGGREKPTGSFLFVGPTGVGKTELAKQLAQSLGAPFLRFDMSEYMEKHAVAKLVGAPPGYVGYDEGGQLVEQVRKKPNAVVLLDEIEKAHPDLYDILLQVMDRATLTDNHGREADFRNTVLVMSSNVGSRENQKAAIGFAGGRRSGRAALERTFSPEFRNRLDEIVEFKPLPPEVMARVVGKFVREVEAQLREHKVQLSLSAAALRHLARRGYSPEFGARPLARVIQRELSDKLSDEILFGALQRGGKAHAVLKPAAADGADGAESADAEAELQLQITGPADAPAAPAAVH